MDETTLMHGLLLKMSNKTHNKCAYPLIPQGFHLTKEVLVGQSMYGRTDVPIVPFRPSLAMNQETKRELVGGRQYNHK